MEEKDEILELARNTFRLRCKTDERVGEAFGIPPIEVNIIAYLNYPSENATASGIGRERDLKKNTISVHVENLVQAGFIERKERQGDRRRVELALTERGKAVAERYLQENELLKSKLLEGLTNREVGLLRSCFKILNQNVLNLMNG